MDKKDNLKLPEQFSWWKKAQLKSIYLKDKKLGFNNKITELEETVLTAENKVIKKIYMILLDNVMVDEMVKKYE